MLLRNLTLITLTCALSTLLFAQNDTLNQLDEEGRKQGHWIYYGKDYPTRGYPAEGIVEEGTYLNSRKQGLWKKYYNDGKTVKLQGIYHNNRPSGEYSKFYESSALKENGFFTKNTYQGEFVRFYENGQLKHKARYSEDGKEMDSTVSYYENGCKRYLTIFSEPGVVKEKYEYQAESCNTLSEKLQNGPKDKDKLNNSEGFDKTMPNSPKYVRDPLVSLRIKDDEHKKVYSDEAMCEPYNSKYFRKRNANDDLIFDGKCKDGTILEGRFYFYDDDAILIRVEIWKNGVFDSLQQM